jgi:hypothetical protein
MTTAADVWSQVEPALDEVRAEYQRDSRTPWATVREQLSAALGSTAEPVRTRLFEWLDAMSDQERVELLTGDQLEGQVSAVLAGVDQESCDESAWWEFLSTNGPTWDGTAESWPAFREWFAYQAGQQRLTAPADELLAYLEPLGAADRVAAFARYGVTLPAPASPGGGGAEFGWVTAEQQDALGAGWGEHWPTELAADLATRWGEGWQQHPDEHKTAWLADLIAAGALPPGAAAPDAGSVLASLPAEIGSELMAEVPDLAELSEAEIAEVVAEVLRESEE